MGDSVLADRKSRSVSTPTLSSLKELEETHGNGASTASAHGGGAFSSTSSLLRNAVLVAISAASAGVGTIGVLLLGYLLATHALTPRHLQYTLSLPLDLDGNTLSAQASVLQANSPAAGYILHLPDKERTVASRMFPPGQWMDIWVDLMVPGWADADTRNADLVHVTAELLNASGQVAARATKPVLLQNRSFSVWSLWMAPLRWVGLLDSSRTVSARLFSNYKELSGAPFTAFRLTIKSRTPDGPDVLAAVARIELKVGFFRRILYFLRPYSIVGALLGIGAVAAVLGGFGTAGLCLALLAYAVFWAGGRASGDTDISDASSTLSDLLSAPSSAATTPRDMESDDEDAAPGTHVTASPLVSPRPPDKPWQQLLKQLPLSKLRPATGEDTAYMGSEAAGTSSAASTLRQRRGGS